jgi:hypothetical protein
MNFVFYRQFLAFCCLAGLTFLCGCTSAESGDDDDATGTGPDDDDSSGNDDVSTGPNDDDGADDDGTGVPLGDDDSTDDDAADDDLTAVDDDDDDITADDDSTSIDLSNPEDYCEYTCGLLGECLAGVGGDLEAAHEQCFTGCLEDNADEVTEESLAVLDCVEANEGNCEAMMQCLDTIPDDDDVVDDDIVDDDIIDDDISVDDDATPELPEDVDEFEECLQVVGESECDQALACSMCCEQKLEDSGVDTSSGEDVCGNYCFENYGAASGDCNGCMETYQQCMADAGCDPDMDNMDFECMWKNCYEEFTVCFGDSGIFPPPPSEEGCIEGEVCVIPDEGGPEASPFAVCIPENFNPEDPNNLGEPYTRGGPCIAGEGECPEGTWCAGEGFGSDGVCLAACWKEDAQPIGPGQPPIGECIAGEYCMPMDQGPAPGVCFPENASPEDPASWPGEENQRDGQCLSEIGNNPCPQGLICAGPPDGIGMCTIFCEPEAP